MQIFSFFWANYEKTRKQDASLPCIVCCTLRVLFSLYAKFLRRFNVIWAKWQTMHRQKLRVMISHFMTCQELHPFQPKILSLLEMESGHNFIKKGIIWQKSKLIFHIFIYVPFFSPSTLISFQNKPFWRESPKNYRFLNDLSEPLLCPFLIMHLLRQ